MDFDAPQTFPGILELPLSQGRRIEKMYLSEEERKSKGVLFWVNNHPYASWRLLIMQLDKHSVSNQIHQYAEKVTGMLSSTYVSRIVIDSCAISVISLREKVLYRMHSRVTVVWFV